LTEPVVLYEVSERIATVTLNRPERLNAWTSRLGYEYFERLCDASADPEVRVIIVTGAGRGFCAGADMSLLQGIATGESNVSDTRPTTFPLTVPKPIVAAVNGPCAGLGLVMALMCDVRIAAEGAKFTTAFSRRGLIAEHGSSWILPRLVGHSRALDLLFSARTFLAEEALQLGLVDKVVPVDALLDSARAYARELIESCSPQAMATIKKQIYLAYEQPLKTALGDAIRLMNESLTKYDFREGVASYMERRPPKFEGVSVDLRA
jgi:enoyl-CoA hydratase/carnithine racemase